jgi:GDP/UDP-N,N'-diacetylbacillosamine 2-epimerase (hydrolysing)
MRRILAVTGIRSEYDIMSSVFKAITHHEGLQLEVAVTGAHLSDAYGYTIREIRKDGFVVAEEIESLLNSDGAAARVKGLAIQLQGLVQTVTRLQPQFLLVLGDREEAMSTALVGAYMNVPVAHIAGGDRVVGNVDDQVRHAVTKLAHLHLATNRDSCERILRLGEQPFRVHDVGNPGLDRLLEEPQLDDAELSRRLGFEVRAAAPILMVIQHVISTEIDDAYRQMRVTLEAVAELGLTTVLSYPNTDAGGQQMIRAIREFESMPGLHVYKSLPRTEFVNVLRRAKCLLGNSSAGILEAPLLRLPVVNVGNRQKGRLHAENVTFVPHDKAAIVAAVRKSVFDDAYREGVSRCSNPYGDGRSSARIADLLARTAIDDRLLIKDLTY